MGCLLAPFRLVLGLAGKLLFALVLGVVLTRVERALERRGGLARRAWRAWRYKDFF